MYKINRSKLESNLFEGGKHGDSSVSFFSVDNPPGAGPRLHKHPYEETWIVLEGDVKFWAGDETGQAATGDIVVAPRETPHKFVNVGTGRLRMVCIHPSPEVIQEDVPD